MEGDALASMLSPWSYKSELLTPKPKAYHHLPSEGHHPHQGDKQGKTVLPCMLQSSKAHPLAYCLPGRGFVGHQYRGRCPRLLKVVPSRHQSELGRILLLEARQKPR